MVLIEQIKFYEQKFYKITTDSLFVLLDFPYQIHGRSFEMPSFERPPKPIKVTVPSLPPLTDEIYLTGPTLSVLFLPHPVRIYCTQAVYEQILLKYEEYLHKFLYYEDQEDMVETDTTVRYIQDAQLAIFHSCVTTVSFNQHIYCNQLTFIPIPAGTNLGWCNYKVLHKDPVRTLAYITSYKNGNRFSKAADPVSPKHSDLYIFNLPVCKNISSDEKSLSISEFNARLTKLRKSTGQLFFIPIDFTQSFVDIVFHVLSFVENYHIPIYVVSKIFNRLELILNIQSELVSSTFLNSSNDRDVFFVRKYKFLYIVETVESIPLNSRSSMIVFGDEFTTLNLSMLPGDSSLQLTTFITSRDLKYIRYDNSEVVNLLLYDGKENIMEQNKIQETSELDFDTSRIANFYLSTEKEGHEITQSQKLLDFYLDPKLLLHASALGNLPHKKYFLFLNGTVHYTDHCSKRRIKLSFDQQSPHWIQTLFAPSQPAPVIVDDGYYFIGLKILIKIISHSECEVIKFI